MHSREKGRLEPTDQKPVRRQLGKAVGAELEEGEDAPGDVEEGNQPVDGDVGEEEEEGDLAEDGADGVHCLEADKFVAFEAEVFF